MKLVFTAAVMDLLHEGHLNLLEKMGANGDLVCVILHDGFTTFQNKNKLPIESLEKRTMNLIDTGLVDIVMHTHCADPTEAFERVFDLYSHSFDLLFMRGDDWKEYPGCDWIKEMHIPTKFVKYTKGISSSKLRTKL